MHDSNSEQAPLCTAADPLPNAPNVTVPDLACDTHAHIFQNHPRQSLDPQRIYTPAKASLEAYQHMLSTLGLSRAVIVQPSVYGTNNTVTMETVRTVGDRFRAVVVVEPDITEKTLQDYRDQGARGARVNLLFSSTANLDETGILAQKLADQGMHLQILADVSTIENLENIIQALPVDVVFDHMGHMPTTQGIQDPGFQALLRLLDSGQCWVKLSGTYRITKQSTPPYADVEPFAKALIDTNPERVLWASDWPHPHIPVDMPNDGALLDMLAVWAPNAAIRHKILVDNPAQLYGF